MKAVHRQEGEVARYGQEHEQEPRQAVVPGQGGGQVGCGGEVVEEGGGGDEEVGQQLQEAQVAVHLLCQAPHHLLAPDMICELWFDPQNGE